MITRHINELSKAFSKEFQILSESWSTSSMKYEQDGTLRRKRALDFIGSGLSWCCGVATMEKLRLVDETEKQVQQRLDKITEGLSIEIKQMSKDSEHFMEYENSVAKAFRETERKIQFMEKYTRELQIKMSNSSNEQQRAIIDLFYMEYQNLRRSILLTRALKRQAVVNACKHHKIPSEIVNSQILGKDLEKLREGIKVSGQGLAIQTSEISKYYELPICDCSFTETTLFVHIKIPIITENESWQLFELITTPFAWFNQTCSIPHQPLYMAVSSSKDKEDRARQISGTGLHQCKPYHDKLCYVPRFSADSIQGPECAKKLYEGTTVQKLSEYCPMNCHHSRKFTKKPILSHTQRTT